MFTLQEGRSPGPCIDVNKRIVKETSETRILLFSLWVSIRRRAKHSMSESENLVVSEIRSNENNGSPLTSHEIHPKSKQNQPNSSMPTQGNYGVNYDTKHDKEVSLQKELETVRSMNEVVEKVLSSLECAQGNMAVSITSTRSSKTLTA